MTSKIQNTDNNKDNSKNNSSPKKKKKDISKSSKLAQTFFGLTILIFATYFGIQSINNSSPTKTRKKIIQKIDQAQSETKITEIQEKIYEKINMQPEVLEMVTSLDGITFKPQIKNEKILSKIKSEFQTGFNLSASNSYNMEVDIFNDNDSQANLAEEKNTITEYSDTDGNIVLQISLFEKKSNNKVGEVGVTIPMKMIVVNTN